MNALEARGILTRDPFHGEWNYALHPAHHDTPEPD